MQDRLRTGVAARLSRYLQVANQAKNGGTKLISSYQIALYTGINPTQVRRDLSSFGKFGRRGYGYEIDILCARLREILGAERRRSVVIVGAGRIGEALVRSELLSRHRLEIAAIFDSDPDKIGRRIGELSVSPASDLAREAKRKKASAGVIAVPAEDAQSVADELVSAGVSVLFNYSEALLEIPAGVAVQTLNPAVELLSIFGAQAD